jgi:uncharacterized protein
MSESRSGWWPWRIDVTARVLPFAVFIGFLLAADLGAALFPSDAGGWDTRWLTLARGLIVGALVLLFARQYTELRDLREVRARDWTLAVAVGGVVCVLWIALDHPWFRFGGRAAGFVPLDDVGNFRTDLVALRLIGLVIVVPVMEELFWRSFLMRWLTRPDFLSVSPAAVSLPAFLITGALFALAHDLWAAGFVAGVAYNWLYMHTRTLWAPILAHAVTNGFLAAYILWARAWHLW